MCSLLSTDSEFLGVNLCLEIEMKKLLLALALLVSTNAFAGNDWQYPVMGAIGGFGASAFGSDNNPTSGSQYRRDAALQSGDVAEGTVIQVRKVVLQSTAYARNVGTAAGGAIGAAAGASLGKGNGKLVRAILGGVIGAGVGQATGEAISERVSGEIVLQIDNGKKMYIVQEDGLQFQKGDRVIVLKSGGAWSSSMRVARLEQ